MMLRSGIDLLGEGGVGGSSVILTFGSLRSGAWAGKLIVYPELSMVFFECFFLELICQTFLLSLV